jgi:hypothetical protein
MCSCGWATDWSDRKTAASALREHIGWVIAFAALPDRRVVQLANRCPVGSDY